jgi:hypothetical protein
VGHHLLLVPLVLVAGFTIRDDLRDGKIYNKRLLQGLAGGAIAYTLLGVAELLHMSPSLCSAPPPEGTWHWSLVVLLNLGLALLAGILLWIFGIWAAGDAKLFTLYAFLVPPAVYTHSYLPTFPALPILVNVFAFVFLFLIADLLRTGIPAIFRTLSDPDKRAAWLRSAPSSLLRLVPAVLTLIALFAGIRTIREVSRESVAPFLHVSDFTMFLLLFVVFRPLMRLVTNKWGAIVFTILSVAGLALLIFRHGLSDVPHLIQPSLFAVALLVFARAYPGFGQTSIKRKVKDLEPGVLLSRESLAALKQRQAREAAEQDLPDHEEPGTTAVPSRFGKVTVEGLTAEQVRYIRTRWQDDEHILVARTLPFSPFLAAGALVTYVIGGPLTMFVSIH